MKIKDSFWLGLLIGVAVFALFYFPLSLIEWERPRNPFLLAFIPGIILFRMAMVKWDMEKCGKGILAVSFVGLLLVFFLL